MDFFTPIPSLKISNILDDYFKKLKEQKVYVVIIGANDGEIADFLTGRLKGDNMIGLLVEPIFYLYQKLSEKMGSNKNLLFENSAIDVKNKKKVLYRLIQDDSLPSWSKGLGSFNKDVILAHENQISNLEKHLFKEVVNCITFTSLIEKFELPTINVLQIDTEGHDFEIIRNIDYDFKRPDIIIFESLHLTIYECYSCKAFLEKHNYFVAANTDSYDIIAINNNIL